MASCSFCSLVVSMLFLVVSLGLTVTSIMTDYWYFVETEGSVTDTAKREGNYNFGFWRKCYDHPPSRLGGDDCEMIYYDLIEEWKENITHYEEVVIHLSRSYICLAILSGAAQLATIIILLCGSWPGCKAVPKHPLFISAVIVLLIGICGGISSGICFIAARDVEDKELQIYNNLSTDYGWSFMVNWAATGLCLINSFVIICMIKYAYDDVSYDHKYYYES